MKGATQKRGSPTEGTSGDDRWNGVGPWGPGRPADRYGWSEPTKRRVVTCGGIRKYSVTYAARSRGPADRKPISEDAEGTGACAARHSRRQKYPGLMDQPVGNSINKCLMR